MQGKEKDVIILSLARTNGTGFLDNDPRINVALTRARKCLIICGNFCSLQRASNWGELLQDASHRKVYIEASCTTPDDLKLLILKP